MPQPTFSIVTVSLNQADTIDQAMRSVLGQRGVDVEYIVVDGGSTDGTRETIARHADRLAWWVSEPDAGQSDALNKGFARATGRIFGWLNADDFLLPGALARVAERFDQTPCGVLCGACRYEGEAGGGRVVGVRARDLRRLDVYDPIHQPSCFWRSELHRRARGLNATLRYGMDWDLWLRFAALGARFEAFEDVLSVYRVTGVNKTSVGGDRRNEELYELLCRYTQGEARLLTELGYRLLWPLKRLRSREPGWLCRPLSNLARTGLLVALGPMLGFERVRCSTHPYA